MTQPIDGPLPALSKDDFLWLFGLDHELSPEELKPLLESFDVSDFSIESGEIVDFFLLKFDNQNLVATGWTWVTSEKRGAGIVCGLIQKQIEQAKKYGMVKLMGCFLEGHPNLRPGEKTRFGFELEAHLKKHYKIGSKRYDVFIYSKML